MSQKTRVTESMRDSHATTDASGKTQIPNLEDWMGEIEEFASEISGDLNSITEMLGERSITLSRPATSVAESREPAKSSEGKTDQVDAETALPIESNKKDRSDKVGAVKSGAARDRKQLSSLKQRLAEMKSVNDDFGQNFSDGGQADD